MNTLLSHANLYLFERIHGLVVEGIIPETLVYFLAEILPYFLGIFALFFLFSGKEKRTAFRVGAEVFLIAGIASLIASCVKSLIAEPRPFVSIPDLIPVFLYGGFDGFPSGHTAFFTALGGALSLRSPHLGSVYVFLALTIGLARVASGVHWPFDILGGFILGLLVSLIYRSWKTRIHQQKVHSAMLSVRKELHDDR